MKKILFQLHWLLGITAGTVLALVGVTGAIQSFEGEIIKALNPGVLTVEPRGASLSPVALVDKIRAQLPDDKLQSLTLSADPRDAARVGFAPRKNAKPGPNGKARGENRYVDPYTGTLLGKPRGEGFFRTVEDLHRWLLVRKPGKQITGVCAIALLVMVLSGLYLRWPRHWRDLRMWFWMDWRLKGRPFLWQLHKTVGTWVLLIYLMSALTGLSWSYEWYKNGLNRLAGVPAQERKPAPAREGERAGAEARKQTRAFDVATSWAVFERTAPAWSTVTLQWPKDGEVQLRYLDAKPAHERANNQIVLDAATLALKKHERYDAKPLPQRLVGSMFALHRGSYFGYVGVVLVMLASLAMPLFAITGWMLYLERRGRQRKLQAGAVMKAAAALSGAP